MAGLDWFEADVDFPDDPKVKGLASRLREPLADAYVFRLYAYCYKYARDRFDPTVASDVIEDACRWRGRRGVLFDALFAVEVLEKDAGKVVVHGVADRLGPHLAKRIADTERQRRRRDRVAGTIGRPAGVVRDVTRDTPVSHGGTETGTGTDDPRIGSVQPSTVFSSVGGSRGRKT